MVIIACEESQEVCKAFRKLGHEAYSCDILSCSGGHPEWHIQGDVLELIGNGDKRIALQSGDEVDIQSWDLMIAHPPCTRLCNSGVMWLEKRHLWKQMQEDALFFKKLHRANIPLICVENPIPHKYAVSIIGRNYTQIIQPWMFGHGETKATCLWLKGLPVLKPSKIVSGREQRLHRLPPSKDRAMLRSKTYPGIAQAMAEQWSEVKSGCDANDDGIPPNNKLLGILPNEL